MAGIRKNLNLDLSPFDDIVARAMKAFASDESYAVEMCKTASAIESKRYTWTLRIKLREEYSHLKGDPGPHGWKITQEFLDWLDSFPPPPPPVPLSDASWKHARRFEPERRAELIAEVKKLRADGATLQEIMSITSLSMGTVFRYSTSSDPPKPIE